MEGPSGGVGTGGDKKTGQNEEAASDGPKVNLGPLTEIYQVLLAVVQSISVWISTLPSPKAYADMFASTFNTLAVDFTSFVNSSPLIMPLAQFFAAMIVVGILFYYLEADQTAFKWNLARYASRRDQIDNRRKF